MAHWNCQGLMSNFDNTVRQILAKLNIEVVPKVKQNSLCVEEIKKKIQEALPSVPGGYAITFHHCGSAYEGLSVDVDTDFDISVVLGGPFESANFNIRRDSSGFYALKWKANAPNKVFSDYNGYVDAAKLRHSVFTRLQRAISDICVPNTEILCTEGLAALLVRIQYNTGRHISIDLVPQIAFSTWGQVPDVKPFEELPRSLRCYIDTLNNDKSPIMCFNLAGPRIQDFPNSDQLFNVSFCLLEKKFICSKDSLRNMVRMVKLVAKQQEWKAKYRFQPYFVKTIAIKYFNELEDKDVWEGYKTLLCYLRKEVRNGKIDRYFVTGDFHPQRWSTKKSLEFQNDIFHAMMLDPRDIEKLV